LAQEGPGGWQKLVVCKVGDVGPTAGASRPCGQPLKSRRGGIPVTSPLRGHADWVEQRTNATRVELRLRQVVAETLGISADELTGPVSLVDDLAVDSLDLLELAIGIEEALNVSLPQRLIAAVRTYGDLAALVVDRVPYAAMRAEEPVLVRARITPPGSLLGRAIVRVLALTPYAIEMITEDARRAGPGTRVEIRVPGGSREPVVTSLRATFGDLAACGIAVDVNQDERWQA